MQKKNMMKKYGINSVYICAFSILAVLYTQRTFGQHDSLLKTRAVLIVEGDLFEFSNLNSNTIFCLDSILSKYTLDTLKSDGISGCSFFKVQPKFISYPNELKTCCYYLAYSRFNNRFYKLTGFKNSEFSEFYNIILLGGGVSFQGIIKNNKKRLKYILGNVSIDEINIKTLYYYYYFDDRNSAFDSSSCYRKSIIVTN